MDKVRTLFLPPPDGLPLYWIGMGEETRRSESYRWHGRSRGPEETILWQVTLSGKGWIETGDAAPRALGPGDGFLARVPSDHCYFYRERHPAWHFVWMMWAGPAVRTLWECLGKTDVRFVSKSGSGPHVGFARSLLRSRASGIPSTREDASDAYRLLLELCRPESPARAPSASSTKKPRAVLPRLEKAARKHPGAPVGKEGLAASLELSRFQLYRALRRETGLGPKDWTAKRRIDHACRLLRETALPVAEVAVAVGLPDANYFARFFRQRTGFTPRDWKRLFGSP